MAELFETVQRVRRSAEISECGKYRWWLRRDWQLWNDAGEHVTGKGVCCFVMHNPSTADAMQDDPTIRRCINFARAWGYDTLSVRNIYAFRATDPRDLPRTMDEAVGGNRGDSELLSALTADLVIAAWGSTLPHHGSRERIVLSMFQQFAPAKEIYCLGTTKDGHPRHPLYVKGDTMPQLFPPTPTKAKGDSSNG